MSPGCERRRRPPTLHPYLEGGLGYAHNVFTEEGTGVPERAREANLPVAPKRKVASVDEEPHLARPPPPAGSLSPQQTKRSAALHLGSPRQVWVAKKRLGAVWAPGSSSSGGGEEGPPRERVPVTEERTQGAAVARESLLGERASLETREQWEVDWIFFHERRGNKRGEGSPSTSTSAEQGRELARVQALGRGV